MLVLIASIVLLSTACATKVYRTGDVRNCALSTENGLIHRMAVFPGGGFDNLRNEDMDLVHPITYSQCKTTPDGKYLIPDNTFAIPLQQSNLMYHSEIFHHWDNYTDLTSFSINADTSFAAINGKFSKGYKDIKLNQIEKRAKTARIQARHTFYDIRLKTRAELDPDFKAAVVDIGTHVNNNQTEYAAYLAQLLVRDYGTHYTTSVKVGAVLAKNDHLRASFLHKSKKDTSFISASAGFLLFGTSTSLGTQYNETKLNKYKENIRYTEIVAHGGPPVSVYGDKITDWEKGVPNALVAIDRTGNPLYHAINTVTIHDFPDTIVYKVSELVKSATIQYYNENTFKGCTDPASPNFNYQANLEDAAACKTNTGEYRALPRFGGIYQTCRGVRTTDDNIFCTSPYASWQQTNPLTGNFDCPPKYKAIYLYRNTNAYYMFKNIYHPLQYETYWCANWTASSELPAEKGYLFGGFYTPTVDNFLTGDKTCPEFFYGVSMLESVTLCVSTDFEQGRKYAVEFGGFFSCLAGIPTVLESDSTPAEKSPKGCPGGTTQHNMNITQDENKCQISYCSTDNDTTRSISMSLTPIKKPPFNKQPDYNSDKTETSYNWWKD